MEASVPRDGVADAFRERVAPFLQSTTKARFPWWFDGGRHWLHGAQALVTNDVDTRPEVPLIDVHRDRAQCGVAVGKPDRKHPHRKARRNTQYYDRHHWRMER